MAFNRTGITGGSTARSDQVLQIIRALEGDSNQGQPISLTALNSASSFALDVKNAGAGGALRVQNTGGTAFLTVNDSGVTLAVGTQTTGLTGVSATGTWNAAGETFHGLDVAITRTAAAAASRLFRVRQDTNSIFEVRAVASAGTGLEIIPAAAASGASLAVLSTGTNEGLLIDAKGSGTIRFGATSTGAVEFSRNAVPTSSDGAALGTTSLMWSDLFLASGGVINFNNGNVTVTHSAGVLTTNGALTVSNNAMTFGAASGTNNFNMVQSSSKSALRCDNSTDRLIVGAGFAQVHINPTGTPAIHLTSGKTIADVTSGNPWITFNASQAMTFGGDVTASTGVRIGADAAANEIDDASQGAATTALFIGNQQITVSSDVRLKTAIEDTRLDALGLIDRLRVVDYTWDDPADRAERNRNSRGRWTGLLAQEVVDVLPYLVNAPDPDCPTCRAGRRCNAHPSYWHADWGHEFGLVARAFQQVSARLAALEAR